MFARKVNFCWLSTLKRCGLVVALSGATLAFGQFGIGGGGSVGSQGDGAAPERRLYPNGLPKIEVMLKAALEHHPDVLAARSKLRTAEAEQRQAELKAIKDLMDVRDRWEKANQFAAKAAESANPVLLREALGNQAAIEWELAFLLGTRGEFATSKKDAVEAGETPTQIPAAVVAPVVIGREVPRGEAFAAMKKKLTQKIDIEFDAIPLRDVAAYLSEKSGIRFLLDNTMLEESGISVDWPITCNLGELDLATALQAMEDLQKPLYFIIRDYGILLTTDGRRSSQTISAIDFAKLTEEELRDKLQKQRQEEADRARNGARGGRGMGGGAF